MLNILDPVTNFGKVVVSTGYDAAATSIVLQSGEGAKLPDPASVGAFNLVWWNSTDQGDPADDANKEIVRCTARSTDTLTIVRGQEGTSASTKNTSGKTYKMVLAPTKKLRDDIETQFVLVTPDPTKNLRVFEDFLGGLTTSGNIGTYGWGFAGSGSVVYITPALGEIGVMAVNSPAVAGGMSVTLGGIASGYAFVGNQGNITVIIRARNGQAANANFTQRFGWSNSPTSGDASDGVYFRAVGTGNWFAVTRAGSTETATDTGIAQSTSWKRFKITSDGTTVKFYIDDVLKATHTTNIPTAATQRCWLQAETSASIAYTNQFDYYYFEVTGFSR